MTPARDYALTTATIAGVAILFSIFATIALAVYLAAELLGWVASPFIRVSVEGRR